MLLGIVAIVSLAFGLACYVFGLGTRSRVFVLIGTSAGVLLIALLWEMAPAAFERASGLVRHALGRSASRLVVPALAVAIVLSVMLIDRVARLSRAIACVEPVEIGTDSSGVYRAADARPDLFPNGGAIAVSAPDDGGPVDLERPPEVAFTYGRRAGRTAQKGESGGAFVTFYGHPVDLRDVRALTFSVQGERGSSGQEPDAAVRITTDDPRLPASDREVVARESPSLQDLGLFPSEHWSRVTIDLGEVDRVTFSANPRHADIRRVNKIAFFVDAATLDRSPDGKIRIKDISFERRGGAANGCP